MSDERERELPSPSEHSTMGQAVQEALSVKYVDKIGVAWLPGAQKWALFSNAGKLVTVCDALSENELKDLCEGQDREWRQRFDDELERKRQAEPGVPIVTKAGLGDLDL